MRNNMLCKQGIVTHTPTSHLRLLSQQKLRSPAHSVCVQCGRMEQERYQCSCFFTHNIFLHEYKLHVRYFNDDQRFVTEYRDELSVRGCEDNQQLQTVLEMVKAEVSRRQSISRDHMRHCQEIRERYQRLHPSVYQLSEVHFDPEFLDIVRYCQSPGACAEDLLDRLTEEGAPNVFSFPVFTRSFCEQLVSELENFEASDLPRGRPNTMNRGGLLLAELGFDGGFTDPFRERYLLPLSRLLYPDWVGGGLDSHRAFVVKYAVGEDVDLSYHFDNAEVTLNVCLGKKFEEGTLYFGAMRKEPQSSHTLTTYTHSVGRGVLHRGQHMHGAHPITSGVRYNLIVWMRASSIRNKLCPMCDTPPQLVVTDGPGDGFTRTSSRSCDIS